MNETERDRRVDAAWSAASGEEPPPAVDAAIRAAARRAVDAGPRRKRNKRWWYPLASAAMVALLAVAIVQLTPPEQVVPTAPSDTRTAARESRQPAAPSVAPAEKSSAGTLSDRAPSAAVDSTAPEAQTSTARRAESAAAGSVARQRREAPVLDEDAKTSSEAAKRELVAEDKLASAKPDGVLANAARSAPPPASPPSAAAAPPASVAASPAEEKPLVAARPSDPFPAKVAPQTRRDQAAEERKTAPKSGPERFAPEPRSAANEPERVEARGDAPSASPPAAQEAQLRSRVAMAKIAPADEARAKDAAKGSVEDWIKRIRDLKREGRADEAAKELAAFRAAYGERAAVLLPADLREK